MSERLPMNDESVIASVKDEMGDTPFTFTTVAWHYNGTWVSDNDRIYGITAWQPLPEPYEEEV